MADITQNVIVDFSSNTEKLDSTIDILQKTNELSKESVAIYQQVNNVVDKNTAAVSANVAASKTALTTNRTSQDIYDKLAKSLSTLSIATGDSVKNLLKLKPDEIVAGFKELNVSVDDFIRAITQAGEGSETFSDTQVNLANSIQNNRDKLAILADGGREATDEFITLKNHTDNLEKALEILNNVVSNASMNVLVDTLKQASTQTETLQHRIAENNAQLVEMAKAGQGTSAAYQQLAADTAKLEEQYDSLQQTTVSTATSQEQLTAAILKNKDTLAALAAEGKQSSTQFIDLFLATEKLEAQQKDIAAANTASQATYDKLAESVSQLSGSTKAAGETLLKLTPDQLTKSFSNLGLSVEDFLNVIKEVAPATQEVVKKQVSLRTEIANNKLELAQLAKEGKNNTTEFKELTAATGKLQAEFNNLNTSIKNVASDTPVLGALTEGAAGIAGAFSAAQGAAALFGAENEDLQETLVKVNSVMAISTGLTQVNNLFKKEGAIASLATTAALIKQNAQTAIDNGLKSTNIVVTYAAAAAQKVLNLVMKANPIFLLVSALVIFVAAMAEFLSSTKAAAAEQAKFNAVLAETGPALDAEIEGIKDATDKQLAYAKTVGTLTSDILKIQGGGLLTQQRALKDAIIKQGQANVELQKSTNKDSGEQLVKGEEKLADLQKQADKLSTEIYKNTLEQKSQLLVEFYDRQISTTTGKLAEVDKASVKQFDLQRTLANQQAAQQVESAKAAGKGTTEKLLEIEQERARKIKDININEQKFVEEDKLAVIKSNLIKVQNVSRESSDIVRKQEVDAQNATFKEELRIALLNESLTKNERVNLTNETNQKISENNRKFRQDETVRQLQDSVSSSKIILADATKTLNETLETRIKLVNDEAQLEIIANRGKNEKIKEIEALRDQQVIQIRKSAAIEIIQAEESINKAALSDITKTTSEQLDTRIKLITEEANVEIINNQGKVEKIKEIEAKRDNDIKAARNQAIIDESDFELSILETTNKAKDDLLRLSLSNQAKIRAASLPGGVGKRVVEQQTGEGEKTIDDQIAAIDEITKHAQESIAIRKKLNDDLTQSAQQHLDNENKLFEEEQAAIREGEQAKRDLYAETSAFRKQKLNEEIQAVGKYVQMGLQFLTELYAAADQGAQDRLDAQRQRIKDELDAGEITAKAAEVRNKQLDQQQKKLDHDKAVRNKKIALFQAIINTALAVTNAILTGDPYTAAIRAAIAGAIGAAQIAVISAQPIPGFNVGKKNRYEGIGEVAEQKPEIVEKDGRMYLVKKPTVLYLEAEDKVYTPAETEKILLDKEKYSNRETKTIVKENIVKQLNATNKEYKISDVKKFVNNNVSQKENSSSDIQKILERVTFSDVKAKEKNTVFNYQTIKEVNFNSKESIKENLIRQLHNKEFKISDVNNFVEKVSKSDNVEKILRSVTFDQLKATDKIVKDIKFTALLDKERYNNFEAKNLIREVITSQKYFRLSDVDTFVNNNVEKVINTKSDIQKILDKATLVAKHTSALFSHADIKEFNLRSDYNKSETKSILKDKIVKELISKDKEFKFSSVHKFINNNVGNAIEKTLQKVSFRELKAFDKIYTSDKVLQKIKEHIKDAKTLKLVEKSLVDTGFKYFTSTDVRNIIEKITDQKRIEKIMLDQETNISEKYASIEKIISNNQAPELIQSSVQKIISDKSKSILEKYQSIGKIIETKLDIEKIISSSVSDSDKYASIEKLVSEHDLVYYNIEKIIADSKKSSVEKYANIKKYVSDNSKLENIINNSTSSIDRTKDIEKIIGSRLIHSSIKEIIQNNTDNKYQSIGKILSSNSTIQRIIHDKTKSSNDKYASIEKIISDKNVFYSNLESITNNNESNSSKYGSIEKLFAVKNIEKIISDQVGLKFYPAKEVKELINNTTSKRIDLVKDSYNVYEIDRILNNEKEIVVNDTAKQMIHIMDKINFEKIVDTSRNTMEKMTFGKDIITTKIINQAPFQIDYNKLGKAVGANIPERGFDFTEEGIMEWIKQGNTLTKYRNKRRKWG